jgi:hypothetical protein
MVINKEKKEKEKEEEKERGERSPMFARAASELFALNPARRSFRVWFRGTRR